MTSKDSIALAAGLRLTRGRAALDLAIARRFVIPSGTVKRPRYTATTGEGGGAHPHTPGTGGTASPSLRTTPPTPSGTGTGRAGTGGTAEADPTTGGER